MFTFDPEEQYDPNRPNDLGEYQEYRKRVKEERRAKYIESRRRKMAGESSEGSSGYSDSEEDAPRRDGEQPTSILTCVC
jgi:splicing factor 45